MSVMPSSKLPVRPEEEETKTIELKVQSHAISDKPNLSLEWKDIVLSTNNVCCDPIQVIGVQKESPVAWSPKGDYLAFVSRNFCLYMCKVEKETETKYDIELMTILSGHQHEIEFISFHPTNDQMMITGGRDGLFVWDLSTFTLSLKIQPETNPTEAHESDVLCCCWLFHGEVLVTGSRDANIKIWEVTRNFHCLETLYGHKAPVLSVIYSKAHKVLFSAGRDSTIKKWDISSLYPSVIRKRDEDGSITCNLKANLDGHRGDVVTLTCSQNGRVLFSGARDNTIKVWDTLLSREVRTIDGHAADIRRLLLFMNDEYLYSASLDGTIKLWKLLSEIEDSSITLTEADIEKDREAADAKALNDILYGASISDHSVRVDLVDKKDELLTTIQAHASDVLFMELNPVYPIMATTSLHALSVWDISNIAQPVEIEDFVGHSGAITSIHLGAADSRLFTASMDYSIHEYDISSIRCLSKYEFSGSVLAMAVDPKEQMLYGAGNDYVIRGYAISPVKSEERNHVEFRGHSGRVYCLAISTDGNFLISGAHDYSICVWQLGATEGTFSPKQQLVSAHQGHVLDITFNDSTHSSEVMMASCGNDHAIKVWKLKKGKLSEKWNIPDAHDSVVSCINYGRGACSTALFSGGWDFNIKVWTPSSSAPQVPTETLKLHVGRITQLQTTTDGLLLVSTSADGIAICWNAVQPYNALSCFVGAVTDGAIRSLSIGTAYFATGFEDGMVKVWPLPLDDAHDEIQKSFTSSAHFLKNREKKRSSIIVGGAVRRAISAKKV